MTYALGKLPARNAFKLWLGHYIDHTKLPKVPKHFGHIDDQIIWGVLGNDSVGNCVIAGAAHETMVYEYAVGRPMAPFTPENIIQQYSLLTGYDPSDPKTDLGTDAFAAAKWRQETGITDFVGNVHKITAFMGLKVGNLTELKLATYLFGACGLGIQLPNSAMDQFDNEEIWDVDLTSDIAGGHYVPVVGVNSRGNFVCVTWGRLQAMTPAFVSKYMDEGIAYYSSEYLNSKGATREGFNESQLLEDLAAL